MTSETRSIMAAVRMLAEQAALARGGPGKDFRIELKP